jgi:predicted P-loop ATPase/GTPase
LLVLVVFPARIKPLAPAVMAYDHPDAPKQFGIRISEDTMKLVSEIQHHRQRTDQPITLAAIVEDAIQCHYNRLVNEGAICGEK